MIHEYRSEERLLTLKNIHLEFEGRVIVRDVSLEINNITRPNMHQGQVVSLLGPSGIGKTQLFRMIAGLQEPTSGEVTIHNGDVHTPRPGEIGVVQQSYPLLNSRTVQQNLMISATRGRSKKEAQQAIDAELQHFNLLDKKSCYPQQLSGGQRQRVAIIQQLLGSSHFLLMDEPFSGLDVIAKERVCDTILKVSTAHELNTIIITTHDLECAVKLSDEIWVLGREIGKPGATVAKRINLIERGLAWDPQIESNPNFWPMVQELNKLFKTL